MGRLESLTAWALGRTPYEDEIVEGTGSAGPRNQQYNEHGHPRNPETKRRERENVRAANEVMQVTGVVEDSLAAQAKAKAYKLEKTQDTFTGLRLMEAGRAALVGGVWGVLGLRRRILIYRPYSELSLLGILRQEIALESMPSLLFSGLPTVVAYHLSDWIGFLSQALIDGGFDEEENNYTPGQLWLKHIAQRLLDLGFCYITLHFRMFAILQQLNLIPGSRLLPSIRSFIPFSVASPLQLPPSPTFNVTSAVSWASALLRTAAPMLIILVHGKLKYFISRILYRPIYKSLPRPTGDNIFSGLPDSAPTMEYDTSLRNAESAGDDLTVRGEDQQTLRALEGLPALDPQEERVRILEIEQDSSDDEEGELAHATLISFDVEATEAVENSLGTWSAELRSANEPKQSKDVKYRVTGLTLLPTILATEGLREIVAGIFVMPLEAVMVRIIARAYRESAHLSVSDLYPVMREGPRLGNLFPALALQLAITGLVWAGFTFGAHLWISRSKLKLEDTEATVEESN